METQTQGLRLPHPLSDSIVACIAKLLFAACTCCELYYFSAYLTDGALFSVGIVALIMSATTVIDFIFSFFLGVFLEAVKMPWGKIRSWLLVCPIVVCIFFPLNFIRIRENEMASAIFIIVTFLIAHVIWNVGEAAVNSIGLVMTDDPDERAQVSLWVGRGGLGNTLLFGVLSAPLISFFTARFPKGWYAMLALVMSIIYLIGFWLLFFKTSYIMKQKGVSDDTRLGTGEETTKEKKKDSTAHNLALGFKYAVLNRHLLVTMVCIMVTYGASILQSASMFYFFTYTLGGGWIANMSAFISLTSVARLVGSFILIPIITKLVKGNKHAVYVIGFIGGAILFFVASFLTAVPVACLTISTIAGMFISAPFVLWIGLYQDCAVYSEYKAQKRIGGFIMGLSIMPIKLGIMLRSFLMSAFLVAMGYSATATDTSTYGGSFKILYLLIPTFMFLGAGIVHALIYKLPEAEVKRMQAEMQEKGIQ
ncbi:MAG: MFS transporter [Lachnospiraceae bacterium]|nr:MFS transporter [Lachnospiraceae bacterium]